MRRSSLIAVISLLTAVLLCGTAAASPRGRWTVSGTMKLTLNYGGLTYTEYTNFADRFTFRRDHTFSMIGVSGTWVRNPNVLRGFIVQLDRGMLESYFENLLQPQLPGFDVTSVDRAVIRGVENETHDGISGIIRLRMNFTYEGKAGVIIASATYTGTRIVTTVPAIAGDSAARSLMEHIAEKLR